MLRPCERHERGDQPRCFADGPSIIAVPRRLLAVLGTVDVSDRSDILANLSEHLIGGPATPSANAPSREQIEMTLENVTHAILAG